MTFILKNQGTEKELTLPEIIPNASTLVLAGSETTATLLAGATYLLCINPPIMEKLVHEIRVRLSDVFLHYPQTNQHAIVLLSHRGRDQHGKRQPPGVYHGRPEGSPACLPSRPHSTVPRGH